MRPNWLFAASILALSAAGAFAQPPAAATPQQRPPQRVGGFVPGQQRPPEDPAQVERGKSIYGISCRACHGADLRGGDIGGPNLLRSQLSLSDQKGEKIVPVIQGSMQAGGMPAIPMSPEDAHAVAAYVRSVLGTIGGQGRPPSAMEPPSILVGNAADGKAFFQAKCTSCHSIDGDLKGIATRISDPRVLQNTWVSGMFRSGRGPAPQTPRNTVTATVTTATGQKFEGKLIRIDDFTVTIADADGTQRTIRRNGDIPKVEVKDPLAAHRELYPVYTDKNMHDVTAYLVTVK
ncbi:hypothetical protein F183_A14250 [Bryobacterales bacterium F-183]|nr:hypothetical protein F183_A14250 [Bryobacterales bacterium F-183]